MSCVQIHERSMRFVLIKLQACRQQLLKAPVFLRALPQHRRLIHSSSPCLHLDYHLRTLIKPTIPSPEVLLLPNDRSRFEQHERILCTRIILIAPSRIFDPHLRPATARSGNTWKPRVFGALPARYIANVSFKASKRQSHKSFMQCYDGQLRIRWK